jgi:hypothetical protein
MKITISSNLRDPFFLIDDVGTTCEVDADVVNNWVRIMKEFNQVQKEMSFVREKAKYLPLMSGCE